MDLEFRAGVGTGWTERAWFQSPLQSWFQIMVQGATGEGVLGCEVPRVEPLTPCSPPCAPPNNSQVSYAPQLGKLQMFTLRNVPSLLGALLFPRAQGSLLAVLRLFAWYMQ